MRTLYFFSRLSLLLTVFTATVFWSRPLCAQPPEDETSEIVSGLAFSPDGSLLATATADLRDGNMVNGKIRKGKVSLWQVDSGKLLWNLPLQSVRGYYVRVGFSPKGESVSVVNGDELLLLRATNGEQIRKLKSPENAMVVQLVFAPDGKTIAGHTFSAEYPQTTQVYIWDVQSGEIVRTMEGPVMSGAFEVAFSSDGKFLALPGYNPEGENAQPEPGQKIKDGVVRIWETATGRVDFDFKHPKLLLYGVAFAPGDNTLAAWGGRSVDAGEDAPGVAILFDRNKKMVEMQNPIAKNATRYGLMRTAAFSKDGQYLSAIQVSWAEQCEVKFKKWQTATGALEADVPLLSLSMTQTAHATAQLSPDGQNVVLAYGKGVVELRKLSNGEVVREFKK